MGFRSRAVFRVCYTTPIRLLKMHYLAFLLLLAASLVSAETIHQGKVVKIADGDTLTLLVDNEQYKIRLSDIDTPERKQPFGTRAKQALSDLAFGKQARVVEVTVDRYGRIVRPAMWEG